MFSGKNTHATHKLVVKFFKSFFKEKPGHMQPTIIVCVRVTHKQSSNNLQLYELFVKM